MLLLAVDTSGLTGSLALAHIEDGHIRNCSDSSWVKRAMHSEVATVELRDLLSRAGHTLHSLTHLCVNCGPGSFTGLRVGINMSKTLAYALDLPVAALNTLETIALRDGQVGDSIFVALKAVQNFFYCAAYTKGESTLICTLEPRSADHSELSSLALGSTKVLIEGQSPDFTAQTSAKALLPLLTKLHPPRLFHHWEQIKPLYIRGSEAEEKLKKKGLLF